METGKKVVILLEAFLALMVLAALLLMLQGKNGQDLVKVSVIVQNSDDAQWAAFKYGLKMAAEDQGIEVFIANTGGSTLTVEEEKNLIEWEIDNGADAVIVQPVPETGAEEMLKKFEKRVPVMLVGSTASKDRTLTKLPVTEPDNYAMGTVLAEELLADYNGKVDGKTIGIFSETNDSEAANNREKGFRDRLADTQAEITWTVSGHSGEAKENSLAAQPEVNFVVALDDDSLTAAGEESAANNLHGAVVYGIGRSTEAVYYLDTDHVKCLVVPDEFNVGYQSLTKTAESLKRHFHKVQGETVSHKVLRRETLFSKENQEIIFTMSQ
ncbi:sugar ABC transporter substrate-binding protein [Diplocloster modestus]|uniref:Substrate-binding domain-containing protein n=1 Tax=Diplocloster modestus TaxID=2850322 RepID=A0ABS6KB15_9FIRM|nr:substrate-binding domain-containing protein [Diplocloster modestus]MBU9727695.1 substrate-binding domain-containing protein [Diplocloster modestus]